MKEEKENKATVGNYISASISMFIKSLLLFAIFSLSVIYTVSIEVEAYPKLDNELETTHKDILTPLESQMLAIKERAEESRSLNEDVIGYIYMEDYISEAVLSNNGKGFSYYERRNINHEYDPFGSVFLSDISNNDFSGNSLIYGHNSNVDKMFYRLQNLKDPERAAEAPPLIVYDMIKEEFKVMRLFAGFTFNSNKFNVHQWTNDSMVVTNETYNEGILYERATIRPLEKEDIDFEADVVILQTCTYINLSNPTRDIYAYFEDDMLSTRVVDIYNKLDSFQIEH